MVRHSCESSLQSNWKKCYIGICWNVLSRVSGFPRAEDVRFLICLPLRLFLLFENTPVWSVRQACNTQLPEPSKRSSCCRISDAVICICGLITLSKDPFKHVPYKCQSYLCAAMSSRGRDYVIAEMAKSVTTRLHWCWLQQTELYKLMICFGTFYFKTSWLAAILPFLSLRSG